LLTENPTRGGVGEEGRGKREEGRGKRRKKRRKERRKEKKGISFHAAAASQPQGQTPDITKRPPP